MKNVLRPILAVFIAVAAITGAGVFSAGAAGASPYDGNWSVVIYTKRGDCDRALRYSLQIAGGRVQAQDPTYRAVGAVERSGAIRVWVMQGSRYAAGSGRLAGNSGSGYWRTDNGKCSGNWTAQRRTASY